MPTSLALILLLGLLGSALARMLHLPGLLGMLLAGILLGPAQLDLLSPAMLDISADLRQIALVIILTRAGLSLDLADLKRVGRPAFLMCFLPACFEILGMVLLAPRLLGVAPLDAAILGAVVAAVSPAVIVPRMIRLMEEGWGAEKSIPQLILAGASVDDVFVIVLFTAFTGMAQGGSFSPAVLLSVPVSILLGLLAGLGLGIGLARSLERPALSLPVKVLLLLSLALLLVEGEHRLEGLIPFSGLLAVMGTGIGLQRRSRVCAKALSGAFSALWAGAEVLLFVLVGAEVDLRYAAAAGPMTVLAVLGALCFRSTGVCVCLAGSGLTLRERLFCILSYLPKATVQAAIGGVPLAMGLGCGEIVLTVAVIAILITAPLGALGIEGSYHALLSRNKSHPAGTDI